MRKLWKKSLDLQQNLRKRLPKLARDYFEEGREALEPGKNWGEMHAFRLRTKRFRYTLETFRELYDHDIDDRIDALKKIQTYLGDINDRIVTSEMLEREDGAETASAELRRQANALTEELRLHWTSTFDGLGAEREWRTYLFEKACASGNCPPTDDVSGPA